MPSHRRWRPSPAWVVPEKIERQRAQLQDAIVDTHFMLGFTRVALALDPDHLLGFAAFFAGLGAEIVAAFPARAEALADIICDLVQIGDLEGSGTRGQSSGRPARDLELHALQSAQRLGIPLLRAGFPQYDWVGGYARGWPVTAMRARPCSISPILFWDSTMKSLPTDPSIATNQTARPGHCGRKLALAWSATEGEAAMQSTTLKIAFATSDRVLVDQHFGAAAGFAIYAIDGEHARLIEATEYPLESMGGNEDKLASRIAALAGCAAVYCLAVGRLGRPPVACGRRPAGARRNRNADRSAAANAAQGRREGGVAWIDRIVRHDNDKSRFDRMAEEGWQE